MARKKRVSFGAWLGHAVSDVANAASVAATGSEIRILELAAEDEMGIPAAQRSPRAVRKKRKAKAAPKKKAAKKKKIRKTRAAPKKAKRSKKKKRAATRR